MAGGVKPTIRPERLLANLGYGSRKEAARLIRSGAVCLGGQPLTDPAKPIPRPAPGEMMVNGEPLDPLPPLTLILHKPAGYVCSHRDPEGGPDIFDLLPPRFRLRDPRISMAGRLDKESTGMVVLTDDGQLLHRVTSPRRHLPKLYLVEVDRPLRGDEVEIFASGTLVLRGEEDKPLKPAELRPTGERSATVELREGRYHQVRRMFAALGNHVTKLHRQSIGALDLGSLEEGQWRLLEDAERALLDTES